MKTVHLWFVFSSCHFKFKRPNTANFWTFKRLLSSSSNLNRVHFLLFCVFQHFYTTLLVTIMLSYFTIITNTWWRDDFASTWVIRPAFVQAESISLIRSRLTNNKTFDWFDFKPVVVSTAGELFYCYAIWKCCWLYYLLQLGSWWLLI